MSENLFELLAQRTPGDAASPVLHTPTGAAYSYATLWEESGRMANVLREHGLRKGDRVLVQVHKSPRALFLYLACLRAGLVYLPLNTGYTDSELEHFLNDARPSLVVCDRADRDRHQALCATLGLAADSLTLDAAGDGSLAEAARGVSAECPVTPCRADDLASLIYTSGTTGRPKGVMLTHGNLAHNGLTLHRLWGWRPADVLLHALPIFHVHGLFVACHCALLNGSPMIFLPRFEVEQVLTWLPHSTVMMGVPTFYVRLLAEARFDRTVCASMRLFISGSAPLLEETFHQFEARTGMRILERYGMSETGMNTSNPLDGDRIPGTVGPALPGVQVRVVDHDDRPLASGTVGDVQVRGPNVFRGYWNMPDKTAEEFTADGYFKTGDLGKLSDSGYLTIVGRSKDMVISGGYNVYPKEVEQVIDRLEAVQESAVFGLPHGDFGEAVAAAVVRAADHTLDEHTLMEHTRQHLAAYKLPKAVFFCAELPRNTMGKVQKNLLRERHRDHFQREATGV